MDPQRDETLPTRPSLLSRLKDLDDQESWRDFFDSYWNLIYRMAIVAGLTQAEAQDVVQETVITVAKNIQQFKYDPARGSFKGWLLQTTRWRIMDEFRKRGTLPPQAPAPDPDNTRRTDPIERVPDPASRDFEQVYEEEWQKNLWNAALERVRRRVRPKQYQIFDLYVLQAWPVEKVRATLKVSTAQVYLAKLRLAARIKREVKRLERQAG
jgi:RNA polymerase sigma-70 factor (ECF subfamily)